MILDEARTYQISILLTVFGLLASLVSFGFPSAPAGFLRLYFPVCWAAWIACTLMRFSHRKFRLAVLWILIDLAILMMSLSIASSLGNVENSQGAELVWLVCYFPIVLPVVFVGTIVAPFLHSVELVSKPLSESFGPI